MAGKKSGGGTKGTGQGNGKHYRDAKTGQCTTEKEVKKHPNTTITESPKKPRK